MKTQWIKIDSAFPEFGSNQLKVFLEKGWRILDKTVTNDRYINYLLSDKADPDVGMCSDAHY